MKIFYTIFQSIWLIFFVVTTWHFYVKNIYTEVIQQKESNELPSLYYVFFYLPSPSVFYHDNLTSFCFVFSLHCFFFIILDSSNRPSPLKVITLMLFGSAVLLTGSALKEAYYP